MYFYTWSLIDGTIGKVMEPLGDETLLEDICHWEKALRTLCLDLILVLSPNPQVMCEGENDTNQLPASPTVLSLIVALPFLPSQTPSL